MFLTSFIRSYLVISTSQLTIQTHYYGGKFRLFILGELF